MIRRAASTRRCSSKVSCPTLSPNRCGSTAAVCSANTRVTRPLISTSGRNVAGRADSDVGATNHVDSGSESDCTTTANRDPSCSCPRTSRGARSRNTSPRTQRLHIGRTCAASARSAGSARNASASARNDARATSPAALINADRTATDTEVPSLVNTANARTASSSGRKVIVSATRLVWHTL